MFKNIIWDLVGKFGIQIVSLGISIMLTRLLSPEEYGIMGMAMVIIAFAHIFLDLGFNRAIIQQPEVSQIQYSTIFYLNVGIACFLTALCFILASPLSVFYNQPLIKPVFRVLSFSFILNGLNLVPSSILYKRLQFKVNSIQTLIAAVVSGVAGIIIAYKGYGVWSLVGQSLIGSLLLLILNFAYVKWYPSIAFSIPSIKPLWKYGSRLFASGVLDTLYTRLDTFIIAKIFAPSILGYYTRAQSMDNLVKQFSASSIMGSLFPYIAKHQHDRVFLKEIYLKYLHIILFISVGMSGALFLIAKNLFVILFTARWLFAAELFQLMSLVGFGWPVSALMCNIIAGVGNSKNFFRLEIYKKIIFLPVYLFGFLLGIKGFIICMISVGLLGIVLNAFFTSKEVAVNTKKQLLIIGSYVAVGAFACLVSIFINRGIAHFISMNEFANLLSLAASFAGTYLLLSYILKLKGVSVIQISVQKLKLVTQ
jgi:O-antigen/teichoic acid export membrane protein